MFFWPLVSRSLASRPTTSKRILEPTGTGCCSTCRTGSGVGSMRFPAGSHMRYKRSVARTGALVLPQEPSGQGVAAGVGVGAGAGVAVGAGVGVGLLGPAAPPPQASAIARTAAVAAVRAHNI